MRSEYMGIGICTIVNIGVIWKVKHLTRVGRRSQSFSPVGDFYGLTKLKRRRKRPRWWSDNRVSLTHSLTMSNEFEGFSSINLINLSKINQSQPQSSQRPKFNRTSSNASVGKVGNGDANGNDLKGKKPATGGSEFVKKLYK
jgi:hypothetical protein